ncbi:MAG TPA: 2-dehydro-3-deoxygalactonokinase [Beijerinckiaceae bacterium]|jgi:2-dehydro-3-deoxygalactonokinase
MRFILADWGTTRFRAYRVENGAIRDRLSSEEGVSALKAGEHAGVFRRQAGAWLEAEPDAPVILVGMVGSREGWREAPYARCPAGPAEIAAATIPVDLGGGREARIVPGLLAEPAPGAADVMRGEETLVLGAGVTDGLVCLPGTHSKWVLMRGGRIERFASYMTGELYALLRNHSMIGRPATEPADEAGFAEGLAAAERNGGQSGGRGVGLTHLLFGARAATVSGRLSPARLGPYLSGLLTGDEVGGALAQFGPVGTVTIVAGAPRAGLYVEALARHGVDATVLDPEAALVAGITRILAGP